MLPNIRDARRVEENVKKFNSASSDPHKFVVTSMSDINEYFIILNMTQEDLSFIHRYIDEWRTSEGISSLVSYYVEELFEKRGLNFPYEDTISYMENILDIHNRDRKRYIFYHVNDDQEILIDFNELLAINIKGDSLPLDLQSLRIEALVSEAHHDENVVKSFVDYVNRVVSKNPKYKESLERKLDSILRDLRLSEVQKGGS